MRINLISKLLPTLLLFVGDSSAQDSELTNWKSGISAEWGTVDGLGKGSSYVEEYYYFDKRTWDAKTVYLRSSTPIILSYNARSKSASTGIIRYKIDRDRQYYHKWADSSARKDTAKLLPAYTEPFTLASQTFDAGVPVVGTVGWNSSNLADKATYHRGVLDEFGDEWHVLSYASDDNIAARASSVDQAFYAKDGKTLNLVVDPKAPGVSIRATGTGQFYTTSPKAYWTPKVVRQTTYIASGSSGEVTIELSDLFNRSVVYRINGGEWVDSATRSVLLDSGKFQNGTNTLEYLSKGLEANKRIRTIIKNPSHPSLSETHGLYLLESPAHFGKVKGRLGREPYKSFYTSIKTRADMSGQSAWDSFAGQGQRDPGGQTSPTVASLNNAFVALVEGWNYTIPGQNKSAGRYAKAMLLENLRTVDPLGFEMQHSSDAIPCRELHYRGYYDAYPLLTAAFAYDIIAANFRSDQVEGGLTAIEDLYVRDRLASFVFEAMQWTAGMTQLDDPGMWGGARIMAAVSIAMILSEYSSPIYGTSGFGNVQETFPLTPYQTDRLTWKKALFDGDYPSNGPEPRGQYPNYRWTGQGRGQLTAPESYSVASTIYQRGQWMDKAAYFTPPLMERHILVWANMARLWGGNKSDLGLEALFNHAATGALIGTKDPLPQTPARRDLLLLMNDRWPSLVTFNRDVIKALPSSDSISPAKVFRDYGAFAFAWYDDGVKPGDTAPTNLILNIEVN
ncbi:MAG: hypothetical protein SFV32_11860 [Opitutaceae bacterium]|nr:hypothetical protein [Opitutaceae bacterium]